MADEYDLIVLGAGHNGLILQAYLCKAGLKVLAIDRAPMAGGGLTTTEDPRHPGFRHNTHAFFQRAVTAMPWYADLELERHGAVYIEPELNVMLLTEDGRTLEWWTDFARTANSFAQFSRRDAATLLRAGTRSFRQSSLISCARRRNRRRCRPMNAELSSIAARRAVDSSR
jgi:phytoene dehydrogenase-like protein